MPKILLTGATGYIGGSILTALLRDAHKETSYGVLIRNPHAADKFRAHGIATHVFSGLDDLQVIEEVASGCDGALRPSSCGPYKKTWTRSDAAASYTAAINTASASHPESAKALIRGLAKRKQATGTPTFIIHVGPSAFTSRSSAL